MTAPLAPQVNVKFGATGINEVQRGLRLVGGAGETTARQVGGSMRQIAGGVEMIARQGKVTGESLKAIISQGAEMAFMFGAGGPIVGALAIAGVAIYENITNRMKEARDEINKTRTAIEDIRRSADFADVGKRQQTLYSGQPGSIRKEGESEADFIVRSRGLEGLKSTMGELLPGIPNNILAQIAKGKKSFSGLEERGANERYNLFAALFGLQGGLEQQLAEAQKRSAELGNAIGEGLVRGVKQAMSDAEANVPTNTGRNLAWDDLLAPILGRGVPGVQAMPTGGTLGSTPIGGADGYRAFGIKAADVGEGFKTQFVNPLADSITNSLASGIGDAISAGFDAAFAKGGNLGKAAAAFGSTALRTIGGVFKDIGIQSLIGLSFMKTIKLAIASWNPALGIVASVGLIALGSMLQGAGARMGDNASGGGGGSSSYNAPPQIIDRGFINPSATVGSASLMSPRTPVINNVTIIGPNDPQAQRMFNELQRNSDRRGGVGT